MEQKLTLASLRHVLCKMQSKQALPASEGLTLLRLPVGKFVYRNNIYGDEVSYMNFLAYAASQGSILCMHAG